MEFNELKTKLQGITLGPLSITEVTEDTSFPNTQDIISLNCSIELGGTSFLLTSIFEASEQWLLLSMGANQTFSLTHLTTLLGSDFNQSLPDDLKTLLDIKLLKFEVLTQLDNTPSLEQVNIELDTANPWKIIGEKLAIDQIYLGITWFPKLSYTAFDISGELKLAGSKFNIHAITPHFNVWGRLNQGETIQIGGFFEQLGYDPIDINAFTITNLDFALNQLGAAYRFGMSISEHLTLIPGKLILEDLYLKINKSYEFYVELSASFNLYNNITIIVSALSSSSAGWQFEGSTGTGQEIPLGTLIEYLARTFDVTRKFPSAIEDLVIENLTTSFNTKTKDFTFTCQSKFPVDNQEVDITVTINITRQQDNSYNKQFGGHITIGDLQFNLIFSKDNTSKTFLAIYNNPNGDSLKIKTLVADVSDDIATYIPATLEITLKDVLFLYSKNQTQSNFLFGLNLSSQINLSNLPLVGKQFPPEQTISVDNLQFLIASQSLNTEQADNFNNLIPGDITKLPLQPTGNNPRATVVKKGLNVSPNCRFADTTQILALPITSESQPTTPTLTPTPLPTSETDNTKWYSLKKHLGPLYFGRIGIQYQDAILWFLLDASISAAGLTLTLDGLSVGSPISKFEPKFNLRGIGIKYESQGAVSIEGAFLRTTINGRDEYSGAAIVKTETFTISAIGSYTTTDQGHPSLFIYGILDKPIGGPAFFFVTGIALGFAYNRSFILPTLDQIPQFPLVKAALNGAKANPGGLIAIQRELQPYIPPKVGQVVLLWG